MTSTEEVVKGKVTKIYSIVYRVQSFTNPRKFYAVLVHKKDRLPLSCSCPAFEFGKQIICKHMERVMQSIEFQDYIDETEKKEKLSSAISSESWKNDQYDF